MWWKIALAILVLWLGFGLIIAAVKGFFALVVIALIVIGVLTVVKWFGRPNTSTDKVTGPPTI